jgi:protein-tyrosine phosphatase
MRHVVVYSIVGISLASAGAWLGGAGWLLLWPAFSYLLIAAAYARLGPRVCGKRPDGGMAWWAVLLLLPFLLATWFGWRVIRHFTREACCHEVAPGVWVGRRPLPGDLPSDATLIIDLTAEFPVRKAVRHGRTYLCVPTLDATAPDAAALREAVETAAAWPGPVYIHCALGHARSATAAAAVLIRRGLAADADEAVARLQRARPRVRLEKPQQRLLEQMAVELDPVAD